MNDAKFVFSERMLAFQMQQLANDMGCPPDVFDSTMKEFEETPWQTGEILRKKVQVLEL